MGATVIVNNRTVVHKDSGGKAPSVPDFCKTPAPPAPPVPIPYVNIARSTDTADGSKKVKMDNNPIMLKTSKFSTSKGDEAGTLKGVVSSTTSGIAKFVNYSFDVKVEGKNVPRLGDPMTINGNMANSAAKEGQPTPYFERRIGKELAEELCEIICYCKDKGRQDCVEAHFSEPNKPRGFPKQSDMLPEVTYVIPKKSGGRLRGVWSQTGRATPSGAKAPASVTRALNMGKNVFGKGNTTRFDLVKLINPNKPCTPSNVKNYIEIKFEGDSETKNQKKCKNRMSETDLRKRQVVRQSDCNC